MSEFQCVKCGGKLECFGGLSAHPDNWTCPKCDRAAMGNSKNPRCSITGNPCCTDTWNGYPDCHCGRILCKLAAREAELAQIRKELALVRDGWEKDCYDADDLLTRLGLDPNQFRTAGGPLMVAKIANAVKERAEEELARVREGFESLTLQVSELELSRDDAKRKLMERDNEYLERALRAESELADWKSSGEKMAVRFNEVVAEHAELLAHERETHKCLGEILGTDDSLEQCAIRMKAKAEENARDAERINYFEQRAADGGSPALVNDDNGHWAVVEDGMQSVPEGDGPQTISTSFWIEADQWHDSARAAIDAAMKEKP